MSVQVLKPKKNLEGVANTVGQKVEQMLSGGRRYFGSSGAYMSHFAKNEQYSSEYLNKEHAQECLQAEQATTKALKKWMEGKPNVVLVDSVLCPGYRLSKEVDEQAGIPLGVDTDHILIAGDEVILIDTKAWKKKKTFNVDDQGQVLMTKKVFPESNLFMKTSIDKWLDYLHHDALLTGIVDIQQEEVSVVRNRFWFDANYRLTERDKLIELLDEKWGVVEDENKNKINTSLVAQTIVRCIKPYDEFAQFFSESTLAGFR